MKCGILEVRSVGSSSSSTMHLCLITSPFAHVGAPLFAKSRKLGPCDVEILSLEISYSKNTMKAAFKFEVAQVGGHAGDYDDW